MWRTHWCVCSQDVRKAIVSPQVCSVTVNHDEQTASTTVAGPFDSAHYRPQLHRLCERRDNERCRRISSHNAPRATVRQIQSHSMFQPRGNQALHHVGCSH